MASLLVNGFRLATINLDQKFGKPRPVVINDMLISLNSLYTY
ncbi:hypothetical protein SAMN05216167_10414 [Spirosoma endophyticum]|uniref:Uncharacterized protein n=1 Tax=Spirosoma endophyticum TaxID=662367 RepID=A0A1I1QLT1_9BACT|nr:hypothetical protein SAMN05216167_10414 [Spirosoma endophyticum]